MIKQLSLLCLCGLAGASIVGAQEIEKQIETNPREVVIKRSFTLPLHGSSYLGVQLEEVTSENAAKLGLKQEAGAIIQKVMEKSPAAEAGLQDNDVIVGWNGARVESVRQLVRLVQETPVGRTVSLEVLRNGRSMKIDAKIGERKEDVAFFHGFDSTMNLQMEELKGQMKGLEGHWDSAAKGWEGKEFALEGPMMMCGMRKGRLGVELQQLNPQLAKYFGTDRDNGVLISAVVDSTPAATAGLQAGDVILKIEGEAVKGPEDVQRLISAREEGPVSITVLRDKQERVVTATLGKKQPMPEMQFRHFDMKTPFHFDNKGQHRFELRFRGPNGEEKIIRSPEDQDAPEMKEAPEVEENDMDFSTILPQDQQTTELSILPNASPDRKMIRRLIVPTPGLLEI